MILRFILAFIAGVLIMWVLVILGLIGGFGHLIGAPTYREQIRDWLRETFGRKPK